MLYSSQSPVHAAAQENNIHEYDVIDHDDNEVASDQHEDAVEESDEDSDRVGFVSFNLAGVRENNASSSDNTEFRLQRKDTPHFTKGKRIVQGDEDKAREILANLGAKETSDDSDSDGGQHKEVGIFLYLQ